MAEILSSKLIKTRTPHVCFGCARGFESGNQMLREVIVDGGSAFMTYLCQTCQAIRLTFRWGDEFCFGDLRQNALEREAAERNAQLACKSLSEKRSSKTKTCNRAKGEIMAMSDLELDIFSKVILDAADEAKEKYEDIEIDPTGKGEYRRGFLKGLSDGLYSAQTTFSMIERGKCRKLYESTKEKLLLENDYDADGNYVKKQED